MGCVKSQKSIAIAFKALPVVIKPESLACRLEDLTHRVPPAHLELRRLVQFRSSDEDLESWIIGSVCCVLNIDGRFFRFEDTPVAGTAFERSAF